MQYEENELQSLDPVDVRLILLSDSFLMFAQIGRQMLIGIVDCAGLRVVSVEGGGLCLLIAARLIQCLDGIISGYVSHHRRLVT
ncbi:hypothetical protein C5167_028894 [Papaver somniferum]|nr:hypothetical protein C5167_028894 [Papaver somniferum]